MSPVVRAVLSLGSNLGDRAGTLAEAVGDIAALDGVELVAVSGIVETPALKPQGVDVASPAYLNLALQIDTVLEPEALLKAVNAIEARHGRTREVRWGDRTLDIDIVTMGALEYSSESLTLPHPQARYRAFVLAPWAEIDPAALLPDVGPIAELPAAHEDVSRYPAEADS